MIPAVLETIFGIISKFFDMKLPFSTNKIFLSQFNLYVSSESQIKEL